jgi:hypothetical protein
VENVSVSLEKAEATFNLKPDTNLQPAVLRKAVIGAGFTPRDIFITARGRLMDRDSKPIFQPVGSDQLFSLAENETLAKLTAEGLDKAGLVAKVLGDRDPLSLEIQAYHR